MNEIEKYFAKHDGLIKQYNKGDLTKREYLEANLALAVSQPFKPFKNVDTLHKGLFNYQYYNAFAKHLKYLSGIKGIEGEKRREYQDKCNEFYHLKDRATQKILKLLDFQRVHGYFIKVRSQYLKDKLFEIVLEDSNIVLHSTSEAILSQMRYEGVFIEEKRTSLIDGYINQKY